ncbi:MAG: hypothetical protein E6H54_02395 [Betaproteobacteria bacterium]|nr:MAG: hypothetical protein E6H54_02395 [Betaproteobacteria bacterium]
MSGIAVFRAASYAASSLLLGGIMEVNADRRTWLQRATSIADFSLKTLSALAIVAAGLWTVWTFVISRSDAENLNLTVATEAVEYDGQVRLLVIHSKPRNLGRTLGRPKRYELFIRQLPNGAAKWNIVDLRTVSPLVSIDMLKTFKAGYEIEPGVEYDDVQLVAVPLGALVAISAEIGFRDGSVIDVHEVLRVR